MKIAYRRQDGHTSTAYLDDYDEHDGPTYHGADKYTDDPVTVQWDGNQWVQPGDQQ